MANLLALLKRHPKAFKIVTAIITIFLVCAAALIAMFECIPHWSAQTVTLSSTTIGSTVVRKDEALLKFNTIGTGKAYIYDEGVWKPILNKKELVKLETPLIWKVNQLGSVVGQTGSFFATLA